MLSYSTLAVSVAEADTYAESRAWGDWTGEEAAKTAALRRGQDHIASLFNDRWNVEFNDATAPELVKFAIITAARRDLVSPGSLGKRGGLIKSVGAGSARVEFVDHAKADTFADDIDRMLAGLVHPARGNTTATFLARA